MSIKEALKKNAIETLKIMIGWKRKRFEQLLILFLHVMFIGYLYINSDLSLPLNILTYCIFFMIMFTFISFIRGVLIIPNDTYYFKINKLIQEIEDYFIDEKNIMFMKSYLNRDAIHKIPQKLNLSNLPSDDVIEFWRYHLKVERDSIINLPTLISMYAAFTYRYIFDSVTSVEGINLILIQKTLSILTKGPIAYALQSILLFFIIENVIGKKMKINKAIYRLDYLQNIQNQSPNTTSEQGPLLG